MTIPIDSQNLESFVPVYDVMPDKWEEARSQVVEQLKRLANAVNVREIGFFLDQELISGKLFIPGANEVLDGGSTQQFRTILRIVIPVPGGLVLGPNPVPNINITNDANFTLIDLWCAATNSTTLKSTIFCNSTTINLTGTTVTVTSDGTYNRANIVIEYMQEL